MTGTDPGSKGERAAKALGYSRGQLKGNIKFREPFKRALEIVSNAQEFPGPGLFVEAAMAEQVAEEGKRVAAKLSQDDRVDVEAFAAAAAQFGRKKAAAEEPANGPDIRLAFPQDGFSLPVYGKVPAGTPNLSERDAEEFDFVAHFGRDGVFMLRVKGDSMIDDHIVPGDLVVIHQQPHAKSGDVVVAAIDGEVTLKTYREMRGVPYLYPSNPSLKPIKLSDRHENTIIGVLVGVVRVTRPRTK